MTNEATSVPQQAARSLSRNASTPPMEATRRSSRRAHAEPIPMGWLRDLVPSTRTPQSDNRTATGRARAKSFDWSDKARLDSPRAHLPQGDPMEEKRGAPPQPRRTGHRGEVRSFHTGPRAEPRRSRRTRSIYDFDAMVAHRREPSLPTRVAHSRPPHVLIIGAGLAGLCLAQGLKRAGIAFTVFERDPAPHFASQGYRVHVDADGYDALKHALPTELFDRFLSCAGEVFPPVVYRDASSGEAVRIELGLQATKRVFSVDRAMLRSLLLTGLEDGKEIQFDAELKRFHVLPNGLVEVHFENGGFLQGTLLVGADGPTSRVRDQYLPRGMRILDTQCAAIYGKTRITSDIRELGLATSCTTLVLAHEPKAALVIEPECSTRLAPREFLSPFRDENPELAHLHEYITWSLLTRVDIFESDEDLRVQDLYAMSPEEVASVAVHLSTDWHPAVRTIIDLQAREWASFTKISTMEPQIPMWSPSVVTLIGDAVHTMAPAGLACNTALLDASQLCDELVVRGVCVDAVAAYETAMRTRASRAIVTGLSTGSELYGLPSLADMKPATWEY